MRQDKCYLSSNARSRVKRQQATVYRDVNQDNLSTKALHTEIEYVADGWTNTSTFRD